MAYATEMSSGGLLGATNAQRAQNGNLSALTINSKLSAAAQTKANDMVARNYWSHNTPDGKEPWTFMDAAGYEYQKAGENLAYGFATSSDAVVGWMNSPGHRANILDSAYREVGFGFANANDFVGTGNETIVVAMYGNPLTSVVETNVQTPAPSTNPAPKPATQSANKTSTVQDTAVPAPAAAQPAANQQPVPDAKASKKLSSDRINQPVTSESPIPASQPARNITRLQSITGGRAPWSAAVLSGTIVIVTAMWALKHLLIVKRVFVDGEQFILHHPIIDITVISFVAIAIMLSQSSGVIK